MIRILANLFPWSASASDCGNDAIGEILRGSDRSYVTPEVLLRIL